MLFWNAFSYGRTTDFPHAEVSNLGYDIIDAVVRNADLCYSGKYLLSGQVAIG